MHLQMKHINQLRAVMPTWEVYDDPADDGGACDKR